MESPRQIILLTTIQNDIVYSGLQTKMPNASLQNESLNS